MWNWKQTWWVSFDFLPTFLSKLFTHILSSLIALFSTKTHQLKLLSKLFTLYHNLFKVHIPPDDTFNAERKTCYLLGRWREWTSYLLFVICYLLVIIYHLLFVFFLHYKVMLQRRELWRSLAHFQSRAQSTFAQSQTGRQVLYFKIVDRTEIRFGRTLRVRKG